MQLVYVGIIKNWDVKCNHYFDLSDIFISHANVKIN